jgi:hypothetical protein
MSTALIQIIAGALFLNIPLIILWVWEARRKPEWEQLELDFVVT